MPGRGVCLSGFQIEFTSCLTRAYGVGDAEWGMQTLGELYIKPLTPDKYIDMTLDMTIHGSMALTAYAYWA